MSDLLIRDLPAKMKSRIEREARASATSLSDAAKTFIEKGMDQSAPPRRLGTELFDLIPPEYRSDDLVFEFPDLPSGPPDFS